MQLKLPQIALHRDWDPSDFNPPYVMRPRPTDSRTEAGPLYLMSLIACVESAHGILDVVLNMNVHSIRSAPVLLFFKNVLCNRCIE